MFNFGSHDDGLDAYAFGKLPLSKEILLKIIQEHKEKEAKKSKEVALDVSEPERKENIEIVIEK